MPVPESAAVSLGATMKYGSGVSTSERVFLVRYPHFLKLRNTYINWHYSDVSTCMHIVTLLRDLGLEPTHTK